MRIHRLLVALVIGLCGLSPLSADRHGSPSIGVRIPDHMLASYYGAAGMFTVTSVQERPARTWSPIIVRVQLDAVLRGHIPPGASRVLHYYLQGNRPSGLEPGDRLIAFGSLSTEGSAFSVLDGSLFYWSPNEAERVVQHPIHDIIHAAPPSTPEPASNALAWPSQRGVLQPDETRRIRDLVDDLNASSIPKLNLTIAAIKGLHHDLTSSDELMRLIVEKLQNGGFRTTQSRIYALLAINALALPPESVKKQTQEAIKRGDRISLRSVLMHNPLADRPVIELLGDPDKSVRYSAYLHCLIFASLEGMDVEPWIIRRVSETSWDVSPKLQPRPAGPLLLEAFAKGIHFPYLYSARSLFTMFSDEDSAKPLAMVVVTRQNEGDAEKLAASIPFFGLDGPVRDLQKNGYRVVIRELDSACELAPAIKQVSQTTPLQLFVIAVHGSSDNFVFGSAEDEKCTEEGLRRMEQEQSWKSFAPGSQVVLLSCLTGVGRDRIDNVTNMLRRVLPKSRVTSILAPANITTVPERLHFDKNRHVDRFEGTFIPALYEN